MKALLRGAGNSPFYIGTIKVNFNEAIQEGEQSQNADFDNQWKGGQIIQNLTAGEKAVASHVGTKVKPSISCNFHYKPGSLLQSITLQYCTTVGLIQVGVLPKPESWEYHRLRHPADKSKAATRGADIEPELMKLQTRNPNGDLVQERTYELFDLTHLEDNEGEYDDDDDNDDGDDDEDFSNVNA